MKNKLLWTTALCVVSFAVSANATLTYNSTGEITLLESIVGKTAANVGINNGSVTVAENASIKNNKNESGGVGGAFFVFKKSGALTVKSGAVFESNSSVYDGGAIDNMGVLTVEGATFRGNSAQTNSNDNEPIGGGAIGLGVVSNTTIKNSTFENNSSGYDGGAISTRTTLQSGETGGSNSLIITDSSFTSNEAKGTTTGPFKYSGQPVDKGNGGAIANRFATTVIRDTEFTENKANGDGGAVYNIKYWDISASSISTQYGGKITLTNASFTGNIAGNQGGAIYNAANAEVNLSGTNVFENNSANGELNDIHNDGSLGVSGDLTLEGGISGSGTTTFAEGSSLTVKTGVTTISNNVVNNGATLNMIVDSSWLGKTYQLITDEGSLDNEFTIADNALFTIDKDSGTYTFVQKSEEEIAANLNLTENQAAAVTALASATSDDEIFSKASENITDGLQSGNTTEIKNAAETAELLGADVAPIVFNTQVENVNRVFSVVDGRFSSGVNSREGISSGDEQLGAAVWVNALYNKAHYEDDTTHSAYGFETSSNGVAQGLEKTFGSSVKAGLGYAYTDTDANSRLRDYDIDTHTAFAYGEYKPNNWYVNGAASYNWSDYKEKNAFGKHDHDVETLAVQATTGYDIALNSFTLTPFAGMRYVHIDEDAYGTAFSRIAANKTDVATGIFGAKVFTTFTTPCGMLLRPEVRAAFSYDFARDGNSYYVALANGAAYNTRGYDMKRAAVEIGAGLTAELTDSVKVTAAYEGRFRQNYYDNTGMLSVKYEF